VRSLFLIVIDVLDHGAFFVFSEADYAILCHLDLAVGLVCFEVAGEFSAVGEIENAFSLSLVVDKAACVALTVRPRPRASAVSLTSLPISDVSGTIDEDSASLSVVLVMLEVAFVQSA